MFERGQMQNLQTPIHNIPVEALREIFQYLPLFSREPLISRPLSSRHTVTASPWQDGVTPAWVPTWRAPGITLYHVCRRWRTVVHDFPALWTTIPLRSAKLTELALVRSGSAPLLIYIDSGLLEWRPAYLDTAHKVIPHMLHARVLSLAQEERTDNERARSFVASVIRILESQPMPVLEALELRDFQPRGWHLPDRLFQGVAPRLRELRLSSTLSPTSSLLSAPLTILEVTPPFVSTREEDGSIRTARLYLRIMFNTFSHLRELHLRFTSASYVFPEQKPADEDMHVIRFNCLERLSLDGNIEQMVYLLCLFSVPAYIDLDMQSSTRLGVLIHTRLSEPFATFMAMINDMMDAHLKNVADAGLTFQHLDIVHHFDLDERYADSCNLSITATNPRSKSLDAIWAPRIHMQLGQVFGPFKWREVLALLAFIPGLRDLETLDMMGFETPWVAQVGAEDVVDAGMAAAYLMDVIPSREDVLDSLESLLAEELSLVARSYT
ncbi:hypothetical protein FA95DRAFT_211666 [Auriscalpium vulgare]|uniref:Uncharacterized protein n=1 Tax=Auriscalpium vulgare TaxID=40419 RepID=A0ACB8RL10_9AGAM|nr:hypothetical protein FA95DRAFT_211666 [Auriscalpium vulgare]